MKIMCMCKRGVVRSGCLAYLLKERYGHDAVAIGWENAGDELKAILSAWADRILVVEPTMLVHIAQEHQSKTRVINLGPDVWGNPLNAELGSIVKQKLEEWMSGPSA